MNNAIGMIEVKGLASAIQITDTLLKVANVTLIGLDRTRGFGWMTIKVEGDVGAVKAAISAGKSQAEHNNSLVSYSVIPRPATGIGKIILNKNNLSIFNRSENRKNNNSSPMDKSNKQESVKDSKHVTNTQMQTSLSKKKSQDEFEVAKTKSATESNATTLNKNNINKNSNSKGSSQKNQASKSKVQHRRGSKSLESQQKNSKIVTNKETSEELVK